MTNHERSTSKSRSRTKIDPPDQPVEGDREDATSGSEGGGPRIGYSDAKEADSDRHQFPHPPKPK